MPALIRRLLIWAAADGLVLQAHGPNNEQHRSIQIDYKSRQIKETPGPESEWKKNTPLESHGVIGLLSLASSHFLIAITQREQVAHIFGKPIYVVTDVAIVPITSQADARRAIIAARTSRGSNNSSNASSSDLTDTDDHSDNENSDDGEAARQESYAEPETPHDSRPSQPRQPSSTSIAKDVIANRGQYGRFASQWFSRPGWGAGRNVNNALPTKSNPESQTGVASSSVDASSGKSQAEEDVNAGKAAEGAAQDTKPLQTDQISQENSIADAIPKILRTTKMILTSGSFFFSYDFDLTRRLESLGESARPPSRESVDPLYFWNRKLGLPFFDSRHDAFVMPILQGFVGQRSFVVKKTAPQESQAASVVAAEETEPSSGVEEALNKAKEEIANLGGDTQAYLLTLISRRSVKRSGLRYLRRGIDDQGNCANAVETEQILSAPDWSSSRSIRSFVQVRGSIPLYFSQSPYSLKPVPALHHSTPVNEVATKKHFADLKRRYGAVQIAALVDKHGTERIIGEAYEKTIKSMSEDRQLEDVKFEWFDFHAECRGMKFENVSKLVNTLEEHVKTHGETLITDSGTETKQTGIIRTNCMDCLDRTNVAQSAFGQYILQRDLAGEGFTIDLLHDETTTWFNTLWADNGDAISRQYASTAALKGDFTRTRRRNYRGALNDFSLTLTRYYNNMVNDYFSQAVIDVLLGNLSWKVFEDFESTMMSADPGISIEKIREGAIENCVKQVIQDDGEDLMHGWTMLTPAHENTLRTLPFEEVVVLLTDAALYCCKFDWTTEKLASFEKADLRSISKIRYGTYITSTFSEREMKEDLNAGVVIVYKPGKESMIRTNTRSLQNYVAPSLEGTENRLDGGTGILSWLSPNSPPSSRTLALKVIAASTNEWEETGSSRSEKPISLAENIADEIRRAIVGPSSREALEGAEKNDGLVEKNAIISLAEAKKRTGYFEQLGHSIRRLVWA
ncbi:hypothetical protein B0A52_02099 [Exophiala mesophila]|uniref:SAC domain-containing protein n=1 Tax=Exophiala mesophila TaxID=212818 RepID=A0A438NEV2_EXOME|nr:hypothetical protein B0A52_02099 [Exophiala mesophila]